MDINVLQELAEGFANNIIVPFVGAGASIPHLGWSWDSICREMDTSTGYTGGQNLVSAQKFVDMHGKTELCKFLKKHLTVDDFRDEPGEIYLFLLSMNCYFYYTTNQDNVFEKAFAKYGRKCNIISGIQTFRDAIPSRPTIVRFHGDLDHPDTVVFTADDYKNRMISSQQVKSLNPLDIRLLADSISRTLLFIGYSFRDPNVVELFQHVDTLFGHNPSASYLIEHEHDETFAKLMFERFKITCINPTELFPGDSEDAAYRSLIAEIARRATAARNAKEFRDMFVPGDFGIVSIVTPFEVDAFARYLDNATDTPAERLSKFRATFDARNIPDDKKESVKASIIAITQAAQEKEDFQNLAGALLNLDHMDPGRSIEILAEYYCSIDKCAVSDSFESIQLIHVHMKAVPSEFNILAIAIAFEHSFERKGSVSQNLLGHVSYAIQSQRDIEKLPQEFRAYVQANFMRAYSQNRTYSNPLARASLGLTTPTFEEIVVRLEGFFPKRMDGPAT